MKSGGKELIASYALRITVLSLLFLMCGCGYRIQGRQSLPLQEVMIAPVVNQTHEPKLQDRLHRALTEEFLKQGVGVSRFASRTLACTVRRFAMDGLAEAGGVITEYRVSIDAECRLSDGTGATSAINVTTPFIVSFRSQDAFGTVLSNREAAEDRAVADLAVEIVGGLIFR